MKQRNNSISFLLCVVLLCFTACGKGNLKTFKAYDFKVDTGDSVRVELENTDGYNITSDIPFEISVDEKVQSQGIFIESSQFEEYEEVVNTDPTAKLIDSGTKDGNKYIFWSYADSEYNIVVLIGNSNTGVLLGNTVSEKSAKECFERLVFSVK